MIPIQLNECRFCKVGHRAKFPIEKNWVNANYNYDEILNWVKKGNNYGVICGINGLTVLDIDEPELLEDAKLLPPTFTVKTGSGGFHLYYIIKDMPRKIVLENEVKHYGEFQHKGSLVVAPSCYDDKTEILTKDGYKKYNEVTYSDEFATLNEKGLIEYHKPNSIIREMYTGEMVTLKNRSVDLLVTPNHKIYYSDYYGSKFKLNEANELVGKTIRIKRNGMWEGIDKQNINIPEPLPMYKTSKREKIYKDFNKGETLLTISNKYKTKISLVKDYIYRFKKNGKKRIDTMLNVKKDIPIEPFLKFMGWWISEGSLSNSGSGHIISISQSESVHKKYVNEIITCIKDMGFKCNYNKRNKAITFISKQLYEYLEVMRGSHNKYIPDEIKGLNNKLLNIFLDALFKGDGSFMNGKFKRYYTVSKKLMNDVSELLLKTGRNCTVKYVKRVTTLPSGKKFNSKIYVLSVSHGKSSRVKVTKNTIYNGLVWCVDVPNHIINIRRNGKSCWSGNSIHPNGNRYEVVADYPIEEISMDKIQFIIDKYSGPKKKVKFVLDKTEIIPENLSDENKYILENIIPKEIRHWVTGRSGWKARFYMALFLRDKGFNNSEIESFLKPFYENLTRVDHWKNNWEHFVNSARVLQAIRSRTDLKFPNNITLEEEGLIGGDYNRNDNLIYK